MFNISFYVGQPHAHPPQQIGTAVSMYDDPTKALAEAHTKADFIAGLLAQQFRNQTVRDEYKPIDDRPEDYEGDHLTLDARQRLIDEKLVAAWGPHPLPSRRANRPPFRREELGVTLSLDSGQLSLLELEPVKMLPFVKSNGHRPSGDYRAEISLTYGPDEIGLGALEFAATTAVHALALATEQARSLIDKLKKEPKLKFLSFNQVKIKVDRVNLQLDLSDEPVPETDWKHMEYPQAHF